MRDEVVVDSLTELILTMHIERFCICQKAEEQ